MPPAARIPLSLWEREKEHIRALYLDQDKTLNELVKCMAEEHCFHATRAQYIRRLDSWKMRKYSTKEEWEYVNSLVRKRKNEGKESEVVMGGKPISAKKLKKELGRYPQPRFSEQPCPISPKDASGAIIAYTPPAIELFDIKLIACTTVPWFLFCDAFIPIATSAFECMGERDTHQFALAMQTSAFTKNLLGPDFRVPTVTKTITEKLPKRPGADALKPQSSAQDLFTQILCWTIYQCSNSLLSDDQTDNFLQWIIDHGNIQLLQRFTRINDPVTKIIMANLLLSAIRLDSEETVSILLKSGVKPNTFHRISQMTALQFAVKGKLGNAGIVRLLLEHGACPNATWPKSHDKRSPLYLAMMDLPRKSSIAKMLILEGADVNVSYWDPCGMDTTLLITATAQEDASLASLLLEKGANPNVFYPGSRSALHTAVQNSCADTTRALLRAGADANIPYGEGNQLDFTDILDDDAQENLDRISGSWLTPIDIAYENGDGQAINLLLQAGAHVGGYLAFVANWHQSVSCVALQDAATRGNRHLVGSLLMAGVDVNAFPDYEGGRTALQAAAESGDIDMVQLLLNMGALVNAPPCEAGGLTALQAAIYSRNWDLIALLMRQGGDINAETAPYGGQTCLAVAVSTGDICLVDTLLRLGADINPIRSDEGKSIVLQTTLVVLAESTANFNQEWHEISALTWSIFHGNHQMFNLLMSRGAKPDLPQDCPTPLLTAIIMGSFNMAFRLIEAGADASRGNRSSDPIFDLLDVETPLQAAIMRGNDRLINLLIDSHADIDYSWSGTRPGVALETAIFRKDREAVQLLLSRGADPGNAMSLASAILRPGSHVDLEIFRMLIYHISEVNPQPCECSSHQVATDLQEPMLTVSTREDSLTPLQAALDMGYEELASMLLEAGADFNAPAKCQKWGKTALQAAAENGSFSFVQNFVSRGANVNAPPTRVYGATALQFAAIQGHYNIVVYLLENGADVNAPGAVIGGRTALQGASENGRLDIVHLLLENDQEEESLGQRCQDAAVFAEEDGHFAIAEILRKWKKT